MMRSPRPRTIVPEKPLPCPTPPTPSQSGLPDDFDFDAYDTWKRRRSLMQGGMWFGLIAIVGYLYFSWASNGFSETTATAMYSILPFAIGGPISCSIASIIVMNNVMPDYWDRLVSSHHNAVHRYEAAKKDWEDRQLETGLTYWREMRGVNFERAVKEFLSRRGAKVEMTKGSGDGGVDLIVTLGSTIYWGQCKGHANPISVAPIREIAGVCSRGGGKPILFAVNGYTRSAITTAQELGVSLFDTHQFVAMAKAIRIGEIAPPVQ